MIETLRSILSNKSEYSNTRRNETIPDVFELRDIFSSGG